MNRIRSIKASWRVIMPVLVAVTILIYLLYPSSDNRFNTDYDVSFSGKVSSYQNTEHLVYS